MYTTFQLDWSTRLHFMADFVKCAKSRRKKKKRGKKPQTLAACILEMARAIFFTSRM